MKLTALIRLLQLSSPGLPIGAYSYSQGLETAVASGIASTPAEVEAWISDHLHLVIARNDGIYWWRLFRCWDGSDHRAASDWNEAWLASRDGAESRAEAVQMGFSLSRLLANLEPDGAGPLLALDPPGLLAAWTFAAARWRIPPRDAQAAFLWSWLETQVLSWTKMGGVGQVAGQKLLLRLAADIPAVVDACEQASDDEINSFAPGLALAAFAHETWDGRLFRS